MIDYNDFDTFATNIDSDCLNRDFDDYDLYGERMEESDRLYSDLGDSIDFEDDKNIS